MGQKDKERSRKDFTGAMLTAGPLTLCGPIQSHDEFH